MKKKIYTETTKICSVCGKEKLLTEYYRASGERRGVRSKCKVCSSKWTKKNRDPLKLRERKLMKAYGLSLADFNTMFSNQNGCCLICGKHQTEFKRVFQVDHCHHTGKVRGLLCSLCNSSLGGFQDNVNLLINAINYLEDSYETVGSDGKISLEFSGTPLN